MTTDAMMMPVPKKYKKGVAAYNTVQEAEEFAKVACVSAAILLAIIGVFALTL